MRCQHILLHLSTLLLCLLPSHTATVKDVFNLNPEPSSRIPRDNKYYPSRYSPSTSNLGTLNRAIKPEDSPEAHEATQNPVEKRCTRCDSTYSDTRYPNDYRARYDDRRNRPYEYDRGGYDRGGYDRGGYDRYEERYERRPSYDRYDRDRYDRDRYDRYDRDRYDRYDRDRYYDDRGFGYDNRGYDNKGYDDRDRGYGGYQGSQGFSSSGYDGGRGGGYAGGGGGYAGGGYGGGSGGYGGGSGGYGGGSGGYGGGRPESGGYGGGRPEVGGYGGGRPEAGGYWGTGGYASNWNYGGGGGRDDGRDRERYDGFKPWDETYRGSSGWDDQGRGYYFASGIPEVGAEHWGSKGYVDAGQNRDRYGGGGGGGGYNRPRDPYDGYRSTSYLYARPSSTTTTRPPNSVDNDSGATQNPQDNTSG